MLIRRFCSNLLSSGLPDEARTRHAFDRCLPPRCKAPARWSAVLVIFVALLLCAPQLSAAGVATPHEAARTKVRAATANGVVGFYRYSDGIPAGDQVQVTARVRLVNRGKAEVVMQNLLLAHREAPPQALQGVDTLSLAPRGKAEFTQVMTISASEYGSRAYRGRLTLSFDSVAAGQTVGSAIVLHPQERTRSKR